MKCVIVLLCQVAYIMASGIYYDYSPPIIQYPQPVISYGVPPTFGIHAEHKTKKAEVQLLSADGKRVVGRLLLIDNGIGTTIQGEVGGLSPGYHGFHVHEKGELGNKCADAGGHFNPDKKQHGSPLDEERHAGDLGNIDAGYDGIARINIADHQVRLNGGKYDVTGRAIVVHADPDDLGRGGFEDSKTTGHAGARDACGVIRPLY